jgi:hypothetical protein
MLSRVIDIVEFSDFEDRVPYQYSHYLRLNVSKTCGELRRNFYASIQVQTTSYNTCSGTCTSKWRHVSKPVELLWGYK